LAEPTPAAARNMGAAERKKSKTIDAVERSVERTRNATGSGIAERRSVTSIEVDTAQPARNMNEDSEETSTQDR
jgi:hypothetical protein